MNIQWKVYKLLPPAFNIYNPSQYPRPAADGNSYWFGAFVPHTNGCFAVAHPDMRPGNTKLMTIKFALVALEEAPHITISEEQMKALIRLSEYPSSIDKHLRIGIYKQEYENV